jgi:trans-2-enoyl-CoA reductase
MQRFCVLPFLNRSTTKILNGRPLFLRRHYHELSFLSPGEPSDVLEYRSDRSNAVIHEKSSDGMVQVEMMHVPWNPADVNTVQGKYPSPDNKNNNKNNNNNNSTTADLAKSLYFDKQYQVAGSEGWGRVVSSSSSHSFQEGSLVTMGAPGMGTLRSHIWVPESSLLQVPEELLSHLGSSGCTLFQLGGTALRMLSDFVSLQPGEVVLQNAGNSGVGLLTSQLSAALFSCPVVSIVRRGSKTDEEYDQLVQYLTNTGKCAMVVDEAELLKDRDALKAFQSQLLELSGTNKLPRLALNAVGGASAKLLLKCLDTGGTMVTYGGMSMEPVVVATPQLIFKNLHVVGYWHSRWMVGNSQETRQQMIDELVGAVLQQQVESPPIEVFRLEEISKALESGANQKGPVRTKIVFDCSE